MVDQFLDQALLLKTDKRRKGWNFKQKIKKISVLGDSLLFQKMKEKTHLLAMSKKELHMIMNI